MSKALDIARRYFELSNISDMEYVSKMFTDCSTYSSQNTGLFLGKKDIMEMMTSFHDSFENLNWEITSSKEIKPNIIEIDFIFNGLSKKGDKFKNAGIEHIVICNDKIQHIQIKNK